MKDERQASTARLFPTVKMVGAGETRQLLSALVSLASELNGTLDLPELLQTVMNRSKDVMTAEASSLMLLDATSQTLEYTIALSSVGDKLHKRGRLPVGKGIAGHVAKTGEAFFTNTPYEEAAFSPEVDEQTGFRTRNILCVPLKTQNMLIGVAQVLNREGNRPFTQDDVVLFQAFADLAAVAIANARLHHEAIEKKKLSEEMEVARQIQSSFLPETFPDVLGIRFYATMQPARFVGGDFYDIFATDDGTVCLAIADVSGKGPSAALYMACLHSELRMAIQFEPDPQTLMQRLNRLMHQRSRRGAFVSLQLVFLDPASGKLRLYSAGHPEPIVYRAAAKQCELLPLLNGFPLGVLPESNYQPTELSLSKGDILLTYTDGVLDARDNNDCEFGVERLQQTFSEQAQRCDDPVHGLSECIRSYSGETLQYDDITMAAISRQA